MNRVLFGLGTVLGIVAILGALVFVINSAITKYGNERYKAGQADAYTATEHKSHELEIKANARAAQLRERNDAENRTIAADGADLRVRGPGKAICTGGVGPAPAASGHVEASRPADAPVAEMPDTERPPVIALPFAGTIAFAEQCDANRAEVIARRAMEQGTK
jgi:hypothetical protein